MNKTTLFVSSLFFCFIATVTVLVSQQQQAKKIQPAAILAPSIAISNVLSQRQCKIFDTQTEREHISFSTALTQVGIPFTTTSSPKQLVYWKLGKNNEEATRIFEKSNLSNIGKQLTQEGDLFIVKLAIVGDEATANEFLKSTRETLKGIGGTFSYKTVNTYQYTIPNQTVRLQAALTKLESVVGFNPMSEQYCKTQ